MERWNDKTFIEDNFIRNNIIDYDKAMSYFNASDQTIRYHFVHELGFYIKNTRISKAEIEIINYIQSIRPETVVEHNNRSLLSFEERLENGETKKRWREIDIFIPEYKLAIEFDGLYFHSIGITGHKTTPQESKRRRTNQNLKIKMLAEKGIKLLIIWENEWNEPIKQAIWKSKIRTCLNKNRKIGARKCTIQEITTEQEILFLNKNHLQGYAIGSTHRLGLFYKGALKAVMTFSRPRFENNEAEFELLRFATENKHTVVGGASKLLEHFEKITGYPTILSYANKRWSDGGLYDALRFTQTRETNPSAYFFLSSVQNPKLIHWSSYRKDRLSELCANFDPEMTAEQNLFNNGYRKMYDCGQIVYIRNL